MHVVVAAFDVSLMRYGGGMVGGEAELMDDKRCGVFGWQRMSEILVNYGGVLMKLMFWYRKRSEFINRIAC